MLVVSNPVSRTGATDSRETGWVNRLFSHEESTPEYQNLKFTLHRKLLDRINLEALSSMAGERVRAEVRAAVARLVDEEKTPLSLVDKDRIIEEILDEVFGLGPLELVINALRMRPDRIIVGEVRAEEALDMLQAMNTGHDGSLTTLHANTPRDGLGRLEVMVGMANSHMGIRAIRSQIASAVNLFMQISRFSDGTRRITHITEVVGMEQDIITLQDIFLFEKTGITESGRVVGRFRATGIRPKFYDRLRACGITLQPQLFQTVVEIS